MPETTGRALNLTAAVERLPWPDAQRAMHMLTTIDGMVLEVRPLEGSSLQAGPSACDEIYVIISGYGVFRCGEELLECTAGDVLFAPRGSEHSFEQLASEIRMWRISLRRAE